MSKDTLVFNGIDGRHGTYLLPPFDLAQLARMALGQRLSPAELDELHIKLAQDLDFPLKEGKDPDDLAQSGWAVVFPFARKGSEAAKRQAAIRDALHPLLAHRRAQATRRDERYYRECLGPDAYRPGETKQQFLARMGVGPGPVDPDKFPYYLLLVASPDEIPYRVQYQLDVQYAVGRIHFDTIEEYARYAESVIEAETRPAAGIRTAAFFGVENPDDRATYASARYLVEPLADHVERDRAGHGWQIHRFLAADATKARLATLLGHETPALLFTASHGIGFAHGDPRQRADQGALLCQDWEGPRAGELSPDHYFAGDDISATADLHGLIGFHFACFGAGTPRHDDFVRQALGKATPVDLAPQPFLARLPQRMLGRARGALAYIGHVDRAWGSSFLQADPRKHGSATAQLAVFESGLERLMDGRRVGHAMDFFNLRYAELASDLATRIQGIQAFDEAYDADELARMWLHASDARNYTVIGDPAVHISNGPEGNRDRPPDREELRFRSTPVAHDRDTARSTTDSEPPTPAGAVPPDTTKLDTLIDAQSLHRLMSNAFSLEVQTFAGDYEGARTAGTDDAADMARPSAYTRCTVEGDIVICLPIRKDGTIDEQLWRIHESAVAQARQYRSNILRLVLSILPSVQP